MRYSDKVFGLRRLIQGIKDTHPRPQIAMEGIFAAGLVMAIGQMGSLNALEQKQGPGYWRRWAGGKMASADTVGRGFTHVNSDSIRHLVKHMRCCSGCLERRLQTKHGAMKEHYHRHVMASLLCEGACLPLDMEPHAPAKMK